MAETSAVTSREELCSLIEGMIGELQSGSPHWENTDLQSFLAAMAAWIEDMDGYYANIGEEIDRLPIWRVVADLLKASTMYE